MALRGDWKSITMVLGEQFAVIGSTILMLALPAIVLDVDSGWYWFDIIHCSDRLHK